jgi:hypothetical protein
MNKIKQFTEFYTPLKAFTTLLFAGLMGIYMIGGLIYAHFFNDTFDYSISFIHLLQSFGFVIIVSLIWGLCFSRTLIKKWKFFQRQLLFDVLLAFLVVGCFFLFSVISSDGNTLWLIVSGIHIIYMMILSLIVEWYFKKTGEQYTELLKIYQANMNGDG